MSSILAGILLAIVILWVESILKEISIIHNLVKDKMEEWENGSSRKWYQ
jgi:hypothetical protein